MHLDINKFNYGSRVKYINTHPRKGFNSLWVLCGFIYLCNSCESVSHVNRECLRLATSKLRRIASYLF